MAFFPPKRIGKILLALVISLVIGIEAFLRMQYYEPLKTRVNTTDYKYDSILGYLPKPNSSNIHNSPHFSKIVAINSHGFDCREFAVKKAPGYYRIAVIGSSNETSVFVHGKPYSDQLHELFQKYGRKIEVINCSLGGDGNEYAKYQYVRQKLINFEPDVILMRPSIPIGHKKITRESYKGYIIDYDPDNELSKQYARGLVDELGQYWLLTLVYDASYAVRAVCKKINDAWVVDDHSNRPRLLLKTYITKRCSAKDQVMYAISKRKSIQIIQSLNHFLAERQIKFYLISYFKNARADRTLRRFDIPHISLGIQPDSSCFWKYDGHMNDKTHRIIAEKLYAFFTKDKHVAVKLYQ